MSEELLPRSSGKIVGFQEKEKKTGIDLMEEGKKYPVTYWAWKNQMKYKDGSDLKIKDSIVLSYSLTPREGGGNFRNVEGVVEKIVWDTPRSSDAVVNENLSSFTNANELTEKQDILDGNAILMGKCYEAVERILGHKPTDTEIAMCNTLFIASKNGGRYHG